MLLKSWPVRYFITRAARAYGFLDPIALLAQLRGFAQPSEVAEPIELLRAGMLFHARGLVNTKAIQNNLDWVWPYWVDRQFNPADESFIPRAFSFSHINLTHRNWTAVGLPDVPYYPIVDPRGLVTPLFDGWSLDFWYVPPRGSALFPAQLATIEQTLNFDENLHVRSRAAHDGIVLVSDVVMCLEKGEPHCCIEVWIDGADEGELAVALRPYNPEGISFIEQIAVAADDHGWLVNARHPVQFDRRPARHLLSHYYEGDVSHRLTDAPSVRHLRDPIGMATAAAFFPLETLGGEPLAVRAPIYNELEPKKRPVFVNTQSWADAVAPLAKLSVPEERVQRLYAAAATNLVLHSPAEVYPGPYTYKRFWFRDAAFLLNALVTLGGVERTRRALREFAPRQRRDGYFLSQEGEWDSNGEAIWSYHRFATLTGEPLPAEWLDAVAKGARWITKKRLPRGTGRPEAGLLPAGFSAEHLGPNDFYYWDDFWSVAGLRCAADLWQARDPRQADAWRREAAEFLATIEHSFPSGPQRRFPGAIPASPKRRMDSGAVGNLVADYPLQLFAPGDSRLLKTADYLRDHSTFEGGFFQNMIHSGINAYLTLHLAQVRLRAGDVEAAWALIDRVAELASPTGQWPEAIHPRTGGGCMGDGQHIWAAAEWLMMVRNCFLREESDRLVVGAGLRRTWLTPGANVSLGPTLTPFGRVGVWFGATTDGVQLALDTTWRTAPPPIEVRVPGCQPRLIAAGAREQNVFLPFSP